MNKENKVYLYVHNWSYKDVSDYLTFGGFPSPNSVIPAYKNKDNFYTIEIGKNSKSYETVLRNLSGNNSFIEYELEEITEKNVIDFNLDSNQLKEITEGISNDVEKELKQNTYEESNNPIDAEGDLEWQQFNHLINYPEPADDSTFKILNTVLRIKQEDPETLEALFDFLRVLKQVDLQGVYKINGVDIKGFIDQSQDGNAYSLAVSTMSSLHSKIGSPNSVAQILFLSLRELKKHIK